MSIRLTSAALIALLTVCFVQQLHANPNSQDPNRQLAAHGTIAGSKDLVNDLYKRYDKYEKLVLQLREKMDRPDRFPYKQLESAGADMWKARRDIAHAELMGEPAAKDLSSMFEMVRKQISQLMRSYRATIPGGKQFKKNLDQLRRKKPRHTQQLQQIQQAANGGSGLEQLESRLEAIGMEIEGLYYMFTIKEAGPFQPPLFAAAAALDQKLRPMRRQKYLAEAGRVAAKIGQQVNDFPAEAARVRTEMATGKVKIGESEVGAPEAIQHITKEWGKATAAVIRITAIQWGFTGKKPSAINSTQMPRVSQLEQTAKNAIIGIVEAAAAATPPEEVETVYSEILAELSAIDRRSLGSGVSKDCQPALARLAQKAPGLPEKIAAYAAATKQPLIWRERFAKERAKSLQSKYPTAQSLFSTKLSAKATNKPEMYGRFSPRSRVLLAKSLGGVANWQVYEASSAILGMRVQESDTVRLFPGSLTALSRHKGYHYANVAIGMPLQREIDELKSSLMISETHPALTIESAGAISSAELEDFKSVGGEISRLHIEPALTRFITLPSVAHQLAPLGSLPSINDQSPAINQACWRMDIAPHWVQHRYFTFAIRGKLPKK